MNCKMLFVAMFAAAGMAQAGTTINLRAQAAPAGGFIRFHEIAEIRGDNAETLKKLCLAPAPENSARAVYTREQVLGRLRELGLAQGVVLEGARAVEITDAPVPEKAGKTPASAGFVPASYRPGDARAQTAAAGKTAAPAPRKPRPTRADTANPAEERAVRAAVGVMLKKEFAGFDIRGRVDVKKISLPEKNFAKLEAAEITAGSLPGRAEVQLRALDAAGATVNYGSAEVYAVLEISTPVLTRSFNKGDILHPDDVALRYEPFNGVLPEKFTVEELDGLECVRALRGGSRLCMADFIAPFTAKKGGTLMVVTRGPGFEVKERAVALENGRTGDRIRVQSEFDGKRTYPVRLTGKGTAEVVLDK